jgi:hypothetical protein
MLHLKSPFTSFSELESNPLTKEADVTIPSMPDLNPMQIEMQNADKNPSSNRTADQGSADKLRYDSLIRPRTPAFLAGKSYALRARQRWEGVVTEVDEETFTAILTDLTNPQNPDEEAVFGWDELADLPEEDLRLVKPGASFYWVVGSQKSPAGSVSNVSYYQFRRSPKWSSNAIKRADAKADRFAELFATSE